MPPHLQAQHADRSFLAAGTQVPSQVSLSAPLCSLPGPLPLVSSFGHLSLLTFEILKHERSVSQLFSYLYSRGLVTEFVHGWGPVGPIGPDQ